jgi:hypothetical protein
MHDKDAQIYLFLRQMLSDRRIGYLIEKNGRSWQILFWLWMAYQKTSMLVSGIRIVYKKHPELQIQI